MSQPFLFFALAVTLGACSEPRSTNILSTAVTESQRVKAMSSAKEKSFNGWGPFTFGMNFEDALTAHPGVVWDIEPSRNCRAEMPSRGCTLNAAQASRVSLTAGVALLPTVIFNRNGKLAVLRLGKFLRGNITPGQCESAYGQLLDRLQKTWGSPTTSPINKSGTLSTTTANRDEFSAVTTDEAVIGGEIFHVQPDGRQIILRSSYIGKTDAALAVCHLSIDYRGPDSLQPPQEERPHLLTNWY